MTRDEFWMSTPRLFNEMLKRYSEVQQHLDWRSGVVALPLYNWGREEHDPNMVHMKDLFKSFARHEKPPPPPLDYQVEWLKAEVKRAGGIVIDKRELSA